MALHKQGVPEDSATVKFKSTGSPSFLPKAHALRMKVFDAKSSLSLYVGLNISPNCWLFI